MTGILVLCSLEVGSVFPGIAFLHWECVCCNFGEWWQSVLHLGMCLAACGNLTSIEVAVGKDFTTEVVMTWQIMMWEQAQAGDSKQNQTPLAAMRSLDGMRCQHHCWALSTPCSDQLNYHAR